MKINSIRLRLTLWYGCVLATILLLFGSISYVAMEYALSQQIDNKLREAKDRLMPAIEEYLIPTFEQTNIFSPLLLQQGAEVAEEFWALAGMDKFFKIVGPGGFRLSGPAGNMTLASVNIDPETIPLTEYTYRAGLDGKVILESVELGENLFIRLLTFPIHASNALIKSDDSILMFLQIGTSMEPVTEALQRLLLVLILGAPMAVLASLLGGWLLAGRALKPIQTITQTAQQIAKGDLSRRIKASPFEDEIGRLISTMNDMLGKLEVSFRQVKQFSGDASHELRTPLTVMKGETEFALRKPRTQEIYRETLESNLEEVDRMSQIINDLLLLSRADLGEIVLDMIPLRLDKLVKEVAQQAAILAQVNFVTVSLGQVEDITIRGDELRLRELLLNLMDNGVKYSRSGGEVTIALCAEKGKAMLSVVDKGIGIHEEDHVRIFNRFYRTNEARTHTKSGTGLGLAICHWIVEAHDARIFVESWPEKGAKFTVCFSLPQ